MTSILRPMAAPWIDSPVGVLTTLSGIAALFFWLERATGWRLFTYFPPLLFIYTVPLILSNVGVLTQDSPLYDGMSDYLLPWILTVMLLNVDVVKTVRIMGRGIGVMLCGTLGVVVGAPLAYALVRGHLAADGWKAFGTLAGSWIGGTANMAGMKEALDASDAAYGLAALADNAVYLVWLPILLISKRAAPVFARWTRVEDGCLARLRDLPAEGDGSMAPQVHHLLTLVVLGTAVTWLAAVLAPRLPQWEPVLVTSSWRILLVTTGGLLLSCTPARRLPGGHVLSLALLYLFVARMGAGADLAALKDQALWFLLAATVWIAIHGLCCLLAARLLRVDLHATAIASAANIGGAASATIVAAHHEPRLVPCAILMSLLGYAIGNYGALLAAWLCHALA